ncbi:uncharacterized protein FOMMEDRAFT_143784 [Fomitiporia mediterranea MF3/22]|uniref:uncharacterized protein n=1 Tax=Fomitiporia mediterranea (strain MF3/22) TaxID=694068 RepID=UPI00044091CF|nr:uncharacterized protein FOMMEDRAFT_143784 [Fomitiporia mediterranea MF3/22]EJD07332.1 hypothetical protein FOMMEDRAFT_143784 [Fomitiporia mediterranea MF3/22]
MDASFLSYDYSSFVETDGSAWANFENPWQDHYPPVTDASALLPRTNWQSESLVTEDTTSLTIWNSRSSDGPSRVNAGDEHALETSCQSTWNASLVNNANARDSNNFYPSDSTEARSSHASENASSGSSSMHSTINPACLMLPSTNTVNDKGILCPNGGNVHASSSPGSDMSRPSVNSTPDLTESPSTNFSATSSKKRHSPGDDSFHEHESPSSRPRGRKGAFACNWHLLVGGTCDNSFADKQAHDRHILTHLPTEDGKLFTGFKCKLCMTERKTSAMTSSNRINPLRRSKKGVFVRDDPLLRHIRSVHKEKLKDHDISEYMIDIKRPWWWPKPLFHTNQYKYGALPRPEDEGRSWKEYIDDVIDRHPTVANQPFSVTWMDLIKEELGMEVTFTDDTSEEEGTSRPNKRRRSE